MDTDLRRLIVRLAVAVMAADSCVRCGELQALERLDELGLGPVFHLAEEEFERARARPVDLRETCEAIVGRSRHPCVLVFAALAGIAASDGEVSTEERAVLATIAAFLGIASDEAAHIIGAATLSAQRPEAGARVEPVASETLADETPPGIGSDVDLACGLLGVPADVSQAELDAAYLRLAGFLDPAGQIRFGADVVAEAASKLGEITEAFRILRGMLGARSAA
jgi:tellurite resistance protein